MSAPRLTAVVVSRTGLAESRPILERLGSQTIAPQMEVIVVAPRGVIDFGELGKLTGFESIRLLEIDRVVNRGEAAAFGLLQARAPLAGPRENHSFPEPEALEILVREFRPEDAGLAPVLRSANPETRRSLAMYLATYGSSAGPGDPSPRDDLPHHNAIFRTETLRALGNRLPGLMQDESRLHAELRRQGMTLRLVPSAATWHVNEARWSRAVTDPFILGLRFGASRAEHSSWPKRLLLVLAFPLITALRLRGLVAMGRRAADTRARIAWLLPMLTLSALTGAAGEAWGYLRPATPIPDHVEEHEFHLLGRLAGVAPRFDWMKSLVDRLPADLA